MLLQPVMEHPPLLSRKGKKAASFADGGVDSGVLNDGATLGDVSSLPSIKGDKEADPGARGSPKETAIAEEVTKQASLKGGPSEIKLEAAVTRQPRGATVSLKLKLPLAMPMSKRQRVAAPAKYVGDVFAIFAVFTASNGG